MRKQNKGLDMFTIKWNGDYCNYSVKFEDGWERLNSCNAATYKHSNWSNQNALNRVIKTETFYLVSYASPIMYVKRSYYMDNGEIINTSIYVNEIQWNCSHTTIQHISRFCRNLDFFHGIAVSYHDIKQAMQSKNIHFGLNGAITEHMQVIGKTPHELKTVFENECPKFW